LALALEEEEEEEEEAVRHLPYSFWR